MPLFKKRQGFLEKNALCKERDSEGLSRMYSEKLFTIIVLAPFVMYPAPVLLLNFISEFRRQLINTDRPLDVILRVESEEEMNDIERAS